MPWISDPDDHGFAKGWLIDEAGHRHGSPWHTSSGYQVLPRLDPRASAQVPLSFGDDLTRLPAGTNRLETTVPSMNLVGEPADIEITTAP